MKAQALAPYTNPGTGQLETSVYRADGATSQELWAICTAYVDVADRVMIARGTCLASVIFDQRLGLDPDGKPHPRHANLIGWPASKDEQKSIQQKIAAAMMLEVRSKIAG